MIQSDPEERQEAPMPARRASKGADTSLFAATRAREMRQCAAETARAALS